jgi:hypothetical protein
MARIDGVDRGIGSLFVAGPKNLSPGNSSSGQDRAKDSSPVVTPAIGVDLGGPTEFTHGDYQGIRQQAATFQILQQGSESDVELRRETIFHTVEITGVSVPERVIDAAVTWHSRPIDRYEPHAFLNESPSQKHALTPPLPTVSVASLRRFCI